MTTKKSASDATRFLAGIAGELTFAKLLISIRQGEEMSQAEFAKSLKFTRQYLCDLERGRRFVSPKMAADLAKKLGYSPKQFVRLCLQDLINREGLKLKIEVKDAA